MVDGQTHASMAGEGDGLCNVVGSLCSAVSKDGGVTALGTETGEERMGMTESTESAENSALEVLVEGCNYLGELHLFLLQAAKLYRSGDETKGREHFLELIQGLEWFVKITATVELLLKIDFAGTRCAGRTLAEAVDNLNGVLLDIIAAQEQRDTILITDLLEYELAPQLELWLEIFTMLRRTRDADYRAEYLPS
jgi:hypothetical protein